VFARVLAVVPRSVTSARLRLMVAVSIDWRVLSILKFFISGWVTCSWNDVL
jgi:hypothetical protein